jgi:hypothetical protein
MPSALEPLFQSSIVVGSQTPRPNGQGFHKKAIQKNESVKIPCPIPVPFCHASIRTLDGSHLDPVQDKVRSGDAIFVACSLSEAGEASGMALSSHSSATEHRKRKGGGGSSLVGHLRVRQGFV